MQEQAIKTRAIKHKQIKKDNAKTSASGQEKKKKGAETMEDNRFSKAAYDPKFMAPSSKMTKVKIDKRFSKMLKDPSFNSLSGIDRYGRTTKTNNANSQLKEYYYMDEEEKQREEEEGEQEQQNIEDEIESQEELDSKEDIRKWMENYNEESSELEEIGLQYLQSNDIDAVWEDEQENVIKGEDVQATKRLALCNYDWMNISAKDLMILFNSFKKSSGYIKSIKVYMSNFGKQRMQEEQRQGPTGIWKETNQESFEPPKQKKDEWRKSWKQLMQQRQKQENQEFDENKLRKYEKERLKYFYAVIECDSKQTADEIYKECDGNQFQNSSVEFDLRFIPDDTLFQASSLKEECNDIPVGGEVKNFINRALGHSKVSLTWQDPELSLAASLKKKNWNQLSEAELEKIDWGTYINEKQIDQQDQMKKLSHINEKQDNITDWKKSCNKKYKKDDDIEITFESGFDTKNKKKAQQTEQFPSLNKQKRSMKQRQREHAQEKLKKRQQLNLMVDDKKQVDVQVNLKDPRFTAVYDNPLYAIDPVAPQFDHRKTGKVFAQVVKRNKDKNRQ